MAKIKKKVTKKAALRRLRSTVLLLIQIGTDGHVVTTFLPHAGGVVGHCTFLRRVLSEQTRNFRSVTESAGQLVAVDRLPLSGGGVD